MNRVIHGKFFGGRMMHWRVVAVRPAFTFVFNAREVCPDYWVAAMIQLGIQLGPRIPRGAPPVTDVATPRLFQ